MTKTGEFRAAGIMGWPVAHSRSPALHAYWLARHAIAGAYLPLPVMPECFADALRGLVALGFAGCNVTIPHKETTARLVERLDPAAARMGAVNLVVVEQDGSLTGRNTDGYGFLQNLLDAKPDWRAGAGPAVVLGAGGGARAAVASLIDCGAAEIRVANRSRSRAEALAQALGGPVTVLDWQGRHVALVGAELLVNTTSLGMTGQPELDIRLDHLPPEALVCDIVYTPLQTKLLCAARARGNVSVDGLGMLLHQARPAFEAWWGILPDITPDLRASVEASMLK
jgi:shikimate dehydrogenase